MGLSVLDDKPEVLLKNVVSVLRGQGFSEKVIREMVKEILEAERR